MLRPMANWFTLLILALTVLTWPNNVASAQPAPFGDTAIRKAVSRQALSSAVQTGRIPQRKPCNRKQRMLTGAVIGAVAGMLLVREAAASNDGSVGDKVTLQAGSYGAALGAFVGLRTCS